jgi:hypothetical protein
MRRMNVRFAQIEECIRTSLFAIDALPRNPPLKRGEELLLQLTKDDAEERGKLKSRIEFALIFDHSKPDSDGSVSRAHWPNAGKIWAHILYCSETIPTIPFSLEGLPLSRSYSGQGNAIPIDPADEQVIRPFLQAVLEAQRLPEISNPHLLLQAIRNYDTVLRLSPPVVADVKSHTRLVREPWLGDALKTLYDHRCQVCTHDFRPRWGVAYADTMFLLSPEKGGQAVSSNLLVVCPNHGAIIKAANGRFDRRSFAFSYQNGLVEKLLLRDHLIDP